MGGWVRGAGRVRACLHGRPCPPPPHTPTRMRALTPRCPRTHLLAIVGVGAVEHLDAGVGAGELAAAGDPRDGGPLVKEVGGVKQLLALLLDQAHAQDLALLLVGHQLGGQHLRARGGGRGGGACVCV